MSPNRAPVLLAVLVALPVALLSACASFDASDTLEVVVPPCIPYPGSDVDPCERRDSWPRLNPYVDVSYQLVQPAPTLEQSYLALVDRAAAIQFVVRAIAIPESTRCGTFNSFGIGFSINKGRTGDLDLTRCFVDLAVNEYIVNSGPARLTVDIGVWIQGQDNAGLDREARVFGERIEGTEWIFSLRGPRDPNNASWMIRWLEDVQLREDGVVVVVSPRKSEYKRISPPEFAQINAERVERTLTLYKQRAQFAYMRFITVTGGRIGSADDVDGNPLPLLASDATEESLFDYIGQIKVVQAIEFTPALPPPVPGENDQNPDGLTVNDIIATRVAGGVAIPGGVEGTATPVSALGDEPTATATVEPTVTEEAEPTATATVEPTATPEPAPTPEPEDTPTRQPAAKGDSEHPQESARVDDGSGAVRVHSATVYPNAVGCRRDNGSVSIDTLENER